MTIPIAARRLILAATGIALAASTALGLTACGGPTPDETFLSQVHADHIGGTDAQLVAMAHRYCAALKPDPDTSWVHGPAREGDAQDAALKGQSLPYWPEQQINAFWADAHSVYCPKTVQP